MTNVAPVKPAVCCTVILDHIVHPVEKNKLRIEKLMADGNPYNEKNVDD